MSDFKVLTEGAFALGATRLRASRYAFKESLSSLDLRTESGSCIERSKAVGCCECTQYGESVSNMD